MCHSMWPNESLERRGRGRCTPRRQAVAFVAQDHDGSLIGFIEVSLRSHADGCDPSHPVGFIEGWYVKPVFRGKRIGARLLREAPGPRGWLPRKGFRHLSRILTR